MKHYWNTFKIVLAFVIVIGAVVWAVTSVRSLSYSGANLTFVVGNGPVTMTNPSNQPIPAQLTRAGSSYFSVTSTIAGLSGSSTKQDNGTTFSQLLEFSLPPGVSEFTVGRGSDVTTAVNFVANTDTTLEATAQSLSTNDTRITIFVAVLIVVGALFYVSRATGHRWIGVLRGQPTPVLVLKPVDESPADSQGSMRSFGDNRADLSNESRLHQQ